jgi:hypothetical protein
MAITIDFVTKVIDVPQADLTFVSGTLYTLDSNQFRKDVMALLAAENHIWMPDAFIHNTEVTVAGTTFARTLEFINGYSITFEDTGSAYTVRIEGSNNNIFDAENGVLNPTPLVTVIATNSAGLINGDVSVQVVEPGWSVQDAMKLLVAMVAGDGTLTVGNTVYTLQNPAGTKDRVIATIDGVGNRSVTATDLS